MELLDVKLLPSNLVDDNTRKQREQRLESCRTSATRNWPKTPFPIDREINCRVVLYDGRIEITKADAIVNPTNENLTDLTLVSKIGGPDLEAYMTSRRARPCPTGDVRLTPGFDSNYQHIIHAVPPKYQLKYKTAAETSLFHTYFRVLEMMIEKNIRTVVMPTLTTSKCTMPCEENFKMQLRVIRRMLEKKRDHFDKILVHVEDLKEHIETYLCYFPRSELDESLACYDLDTSIGGSNGEPMIPERIIRIKSKPSTTSSLDQSIDLTSGLDLSTVVGKSQFSKVKEDPDTIRLKMTLAKKSPPSVFRGCIVL